jgi:hypothetical protein
VPGGPGLGAGGPGGPGAGGGETKKARTKGAGGGMAGNPMFQKLQSLPAEERAEMKSASPERRAELMKKAGMTDAEIDMMKNFRGGGGRGGPGGGGGGGGGFGGPQGGGPPQ